MPPINDERAISSSTLDDIYASLKRIENGRDPDRSIPPAQAPLAVIDPTLNVKEALNSAVSGLTGIIERDRLHAKEIRGLDERWGDKLAAVEERLRQSEKEAQLLRQQTESGRVDARLADIVQNAVLVQQTNANTVATLAATTASTAETLRKAQETTDLATRASIRAVEQSQATGGGATVQRTEGRAANERVTQLVIAAVGVAIAALVFFNNGSKTPTAPAVNITNVIPTATPAPTR